MKSVKSSSNHWEESYYERENDRSKEYHQTNMQKISTSKLLSKRSGIRQSFDEDSTFKEVSQINKSTTFGEVKDEVTNAIGDNTIRHREVKTHKQTEVGTTYINGKKVVPMFDSCSSATVINHGIIAESDEVEIEIRDIEDQGYKMSWRNAVDTDTDSMNYVDIHPPGKHLPFPFSNDETTHCSNHTKARENTKQIEEESVTFPYKVGYGYRMSVWYIMNNN